MSSYEAINGLESGAPNPGGLEMASNRSQLTHIFTQSGRRALLLGNQPEPDHDDVLNALLDWEEYSEHGDRVIVVDEPVRPPMDFGSDTQWLRAAFNMGGAGQMAVNYARYADVPIIGTEEAVGESQETQDDYLAQLIIDLVTKQGKIPVVFMSESRRTTIADTVRPVIERQGYVDLLPFDMSDDVFEYESVQLAFSSFESERDDPGRPVTFMGVLSPNVGGHVQDDQDQLLRTFAAADPDVLAATDVVHVSDATDTDDSWDYGSERQIEAAAAFIEQYMTGRRNPEAPIVLMESADQAVETRRLAEELRTRGLPVSALALINDPYTPERPTPSDTRIPNIRRTLTGLMDAQPGVVLMYGHVTSAEDASGNPPTHTHLAVGAKFGEPYDGEPPAEALLTDTLPRLSRIASGRQPAN